MPVFRSRSWRIAGMLLALHVLVVSALGGAVLERYLLPVLPIVYIAFAVSLIAVPRRAAGWILSVLLACLAVANFVNPPYPFPFENNLAFAAFVDLQENAAAAASVRSGTLATTFPMSDTFRRPEFGFVLQPRAIRRIESFRAADIAQLAAVPPGIMIVYDTNCGPASSGPALYVSWLQRYYGYEPDLSPEEIARRLSMRIARRWDSRGLTMSLLVRS